MKKTSLWIALLLASSSVAAADVFTEETVSSITGYIHHIVYYDSGSLLALVVIDGNRPIVYSGSDVTLTGTSRINGYLALDAAAPEAKQLLAALMMARAMDWRVYLRVTADLISNINVVHKLYAPY